MRKKYLAVMSGCIILVIFLSLGIARSNDFEKISGFNLSDLDGVFLNLNIYKDEKSVLMFFWTTWCPYCRRSLIVLNDDSKRLEKEGIEIIAVNLQESSSRVSRFMKKYNLSLRVVLDEDAQLAKDYQVIGIPTYLLMNKKGDIVFKGNHFPEDNYSDLISQ